MAAQDRYNAAVAAYSAAMAQHVTIPTLAALARIVASVALPYTGDVWTSRAAYLERQATYAVAA